jgi:hypothetical protein
LVVGRVGWHSGQPVHQRVDALSFGGMAVAQRRPRPSGEPVGGLGPAAPTQHAQGIDEHGRDCLERVIVVGRMDSHGLVVFTGFV